MYNNKLCVETGELEVLLEHRLDENKQLNFILRKPHEDVFVWKIDGEDLDSDSEKVSIL